MMKLVHVAEIRGENWTGFDLHYHSDIWQIDFYLKGKGRYLLDDHWERIEKNCLFIIPPYKRHKAEKDFDNRVFMNNYSMKIVFDENEVKKFLLPKIALKILLQNVKESEKIKFCFKNILGYYILERRNKVEKFLILFLKTLTEILKNLNNYQRDKINHINELLETNYDKKITLSFIGQFVNLNPQYLCRRYKNLTGQNIFDYLNKIRMKKANEFLKNQNLSIKEIARLCGFKNVYYFTKKFKEYYKITPGKYRKKLKSISSSKALCLF